MKLLDGETECMIPRSNVIALLDDLKCFFKANPTWE